jgi:hypothetical protein
MQTPNPDQRIFSSTKELPQTILHQTGCPLGALKFSMKDDPPSHFFLGYLPAAIALVRLSLPFLQMLVVADHKQIITSHSIIADHRTHARMLTGIER